MVVFVTGGAAGVRGAGVRTAGASLEDAGRQWVLARVDEGAIPTLFPGGATLPRVPDEREGGGRLPFAARGRDRPSGEIEGGDGPAAVVLEAERPADMQAWLVHTTVELDVRKVVVELG